MVVVVIIWIYIIVSSPLVARVIIPVAMRVVINISTVVVTARRAMVRVSDHRVNRNGEIVLFLSLRD